MLQPCDPQAKPRGARARAGTGVVLALLCLAAPAQAAPVHWVNWVSSDGFSVYGVLVIDGRTVEVTFSGERAFAQTTCGVDYWTASGSRNPYTSSAVDTPPNTGTDPARRCDLIGLSRTTAKTVKFSEPVVNPVLAIVSLNNGNGYRFDRDFQVLSYAQGYFGNGTLVRRVTTNPDGSTSYDAVSTGEAHGALQFPGRVERFTWTSLINEYWNGISVGVQDFGVNLPPDLEVRAQDTEITDGQSLPIDLGVHAVGTSTTVELTLRNTGTGPLQIAGVSLSGANRRAFQVGAHPTALAPGERGALELTFTATLAPTYTASVTIDSNDPDEAEFTFPVTAAAPFDSDADGLIDRDDNCPGTANALQEDLDLDGRGNACDPDVDGDGASGAGDCDDANAAVALEVAFYLDPDGDGRGDPSSRRAFCASEPPEGFAAIAGDNCPSVSNPDQSDADENGVGTACDEGEGMSSGQTPRPVDMAAPEGCSIGGASAPSRRSTTAPAFVLLAATLLLRTKRPRRDHRGTHLGRAQVTAAPPGKSRAARSLR